jgi:hypothetical protein
MIKTFFTIIFFSLFKIILFGQTNDDSKIKVRGNPIHYVDGIKAVPEIDSTGFDKQKWLTSSNYRYEVVKGPAFPKIENMTKKEIISLLGQPNFDKKNKLTYCFDFIKENRKMEKCECSFLTIDLNKNIPSKYHVAIIWTEPLISQKSLKNFTGTLIFKETNYYQRLTREQTDTTINYYLFDKSSEGASSEIEITQIYFVKNDFQEYDFVKFKFIKQNDSLFIDYYNPLEEKNIFEYIYPLNKRDTVNSCHSYIISYDSTLNNALIYVKKIDECNKNPEFDNTYLKDTTISFKDYTFDCYVIEQNYNSIRNQTLLKKQIFIDKNALVPVYEEEYTFTKRKVRGIPIDKWVLTRQMKLIQVR